MKNKNLKLYNIIDNISYADKEIQRKAKKRIDSLAKPLGSLGKLEDIAIKVTGITGNIKNSFKKKCVLIFCSDNGVYKEGIASTPQYVTIAQTINFTKGLSGVGVIAKQNGSDLMVIDVGINSSLKIPGVIDKKIRKSTSNILKGPAMTKEECIDAILIGIESVKEAVENGYEILGVGEMGIANTTTSSAVLISLLDCSIEEAVGKGAGLTNDAFNKKKDIIRQALEINKPDKNDPIDVLTKVGGFDIAAMTGVFIGAAYYKIPVVIDGLISVVAALCAYRLNNKCRDYMFTSHISKEIGFKTAMSELGLSSILDLNMGLGEGSGCPLAFSIMDSACAVMNNMATFEEAEINDKYLDELKRLDNKGV